MNSNRCLRLLMLACLAASPAAHAGLGGNAQSVLADQAGMGATSGPSAQALDQVQGTTAAYTVQSMALPSGTVVHEYLSSNGMVFAVTWQGATMPDLQQLLGSYMSNATDAVNTYRTQHPGIGPVSIATNQFVIQAGGHMGIYVGRAYLPSAVPAGVALSDIK